MLGELPSGWQATSLGVLCEIVGGTTPARAEAAYWNGPIPWASPTDVTALAAGEMTIRCTADAITERGLRESSLSLLPPGTVLMTSRATIGEAVVAAMPMTTNQGFCNFLPSANFDAYFLAYWLRHHTDRLRSLAAGSTFLEINRGVLRKLGIALPPLPEQKKIAAILSSVDEAIQATQAVINQTRRVKEGLLQDLLTRGIGHTRFKQTEIGEIPEGWTLAPFGDVAELVNGRAYKQEEMLAEGPTKIIRIQNLKGGDSWYYSDLSLPARQYCESGDLLFAWSATFGPFWWRNSKAIFHYHIWKVVCGTRIDRPFAFWLLEHMTLAVKRAAHGGLGMLHMTKAGMEKWTIALPPLNEQVAIRDRLDGLGALLESHQSTLEDLRCIKAGLLTDLLTGKVRVTP